MTQPIAFRGDELLAKRYKLVRFIAQGGMGTVYEALDLALGSSVAVKIVRPELTASREAVERFRREISLSRRVTHENVCRLFDIGEHRDATGQDITFLTMELLHGETLAERIRREVRLSPEDALPIARQMAEGLHAAHRAGVVHRDLKSSNVILARDGEGVRAVITDFGLAREATDESGTALSLTSTNMVVGTPAYMAPEQAEGTGLDGRSDLYSFGVVLFEMLTGVWPHQGSTPIAMLLARLKSPPPSPRALRPDLDERWEAAIVRCLALRPEDRFEDARHVIGVLDGTFVAVASPVPPAPVEVARPRPAGGDRRRRRWTRPLAWAAVATAVALLAVPTVRTVRSRVASARDGRRAVAVLGFRDLSGGKESAWLSTALSEMLSAELSAGGRLRAVPGESVARVKLELALPEVDSLAKDTLGRLRALLDADLVVLGSYLPAPGASGPQLRLVLRLQDAARGETLETVVETGTQARAGELVARVAERLRTALGVGPVSPLAAEEARASIPASPEARRLYVQGLDALRRYDPLRARDLFQEAVSADPSHPLAHAALAQAWSALGYDGRAAESAAHALDLSGSLSKEDRLLVEGQRHESTRRWEKAAESYRALYALFPDDVEYGLLVVRAETKGGRARDALRTLETLRETTGPSEGNAAALDLAQAEAHLDLSEHAAALRSAAHAVETARRQGAKLLLARGLLNQATALLRTGEGGRSVEALLEARALFAAAGDRGGEARALNRLANVRYEEGDYVRARELFEEALEIWRGVGNKAGVSSGLNNVADSLVMMGDLERARPLFEESVSAAREAGDRASEGLKVCNLGELLLRLGELPRARELIDEGLAICRETGYRYGIYNALYVRSRVLSAAGDLAGARRSAEDCLREATESGDPRFQAYGWLERGNARLAAGDVAGARHDLQESLALRRKLGARVEEAESRLALAAVAREEGKTAEARREAHAAIEVFRTSGMAEAEANARAIAAEVELQAGQAREAAVHEARAAALLGRCQSPAIRLRVGIALVRAGQVSRLAPILAEAGRRGLVLVEAEARRAALSAGRAPAPRP